MLEDTLGWLVSPKCILDEQLSCSFLKKSQSGKRLFKLPIRRRRRRISFRVSPLSFMPFHNCGCEMAFLLWQPTLLKMIHSFSSRKQELKTA
jgi:hypothetical protein